MKIETDLSALPFFYLNAPFGGKFLIHMSVCVRVTRCAHTHQHILSECQAHQPFKWPKDKKFDVNFGN